MLALALVCAALACTVPWLFHRSLALGERLRKVERKVAKIDAVLAAYLKAAGVPAEDLVNGRPRVRLENR